MTPASGTPIAPSWDKSSNRPAPSASIRPSHSRSSASSSIAGPIITLPYCTWTPIDFWDNPSLCVLDTYKLTADGIEFVSRRYNRPELVPIAKALQYAGEHDLPATAAYCTSMGLARRLVQSLPSLDMAENPKVTNLGPSSKRIQMGQSLFDVERREGHWLISAVH